MEVRNKLAHPCGPLKPADRKAARRLAISIMAGRDHRHTHIARDVPFVLLLVERTTSDERFLTEFLHSHQFYDENVLNLDRDGN